MSSLVTSQHAEELSTGARQLGVALTEAQHELLLGYLALYRAGQRLGRIL